MIVRHARLALFGGARYLAPANAFDDCSDITAPRAHDRGGDLPPMWSSVRAPATLSVSYQAGA
jgi:hypothetical protein